jgi:gamma-glutamyltranspeptidase/glutathione hydrolase
MRLVTTAIATLGLSAIATAGSAQVDTSAAARRQRNIVVPGRSMVTTTLGIVAASQPLAARAGVQMLEQGGNAVDAAIAANAALGLMEPAMNGVGGDLFAIVYEAKTGQMYGLNASGWAPTGLTPELLASKGMRTMPRRGIYTVTVPGAVAGWDALRKRFGKLDLATILAPTIWYAENGFPVTQVVGEAWGPALNTLKAQPNAAATFLIDGHTPREGEVFRNRDLARTLRDIAARGRDGFYKGRVADAIVALSKETGGTMTAGDLADFQPEWVTPLETTYRGWTVYEMPPNSQGIAALEMLQLMSQFPMGELGFHSAKALHVMIEAKKLAYADMLRYVADPRFAKTPVAQMLEPTHIAERAKLIDMGKANCEPTPSVFPSVTDTHGGDTIYLTVIDQDGNIVSLIQSNYGLFGSGLVPSGVGFALHNRGGLFTLEPGHANTLAPRKRPLHTIIPALMEKGDVHIGFGIMGGWNQAQAHAQFVSNIADYGMTIQQALEAGRFTKGSFAGCDLDIEPSIASGVLDSLTALGHKLRVTPPRSGTFGWGQAVMSDRNGVHWGASEPRHDGAAIPQGAPVTGAAARR